MSDRVRAIGMLLGGAMVARVAGILAMPFIARLYPPEAFGTFSLFVAIALVLAPLATLRYEDALPLPKSEAAARDLALGLVLLAAAIASLVALATPVLLPQIVRHTEAAAGLAPVAVLLAPAVFLFALQNILTQYAVRTSAFAALSRASMAQGLAAACMKLVLGYAGPIGAGLVIGQIAGQLAAILPILPAGLSRWRRPAPLRWRTRLRRLRKMARHFADVPFFRLPADLLLHLSMQALVFAAAMRFEPRILGEMAMAAMLVALPAGLLAASLSRGFAAEAATCARARKPVAALTRTYALKGFAAGLVPVLAIGGLGPVLFPVLLGNAWTEAGHMAQILVLHLLLQVPASTISPVLTIRRRQRHFLALQLQRAVLVLGALIAAAAFEATPLVTVVLYTACLCLHYAVLLAVVIDLSGRES